MRVLLVEDNETLADGISTALGMEGIKVKTVHEGKRTVGAVARWCADVVVLDVLLDDINGVFLARALRSAWPVLPIIFSTGAVPPEEVRAAFDPRITAVLEKPYAIEKLLDAIGFVTGR